MSNTRRDSEQQRLSLALSSAGMGTWDWKVATDVIGWDEGMHALFGLAPGTFKGSYEDFLGLIHREDREKIRGEFARAITTRTAVDTEFRVSWPSDGSAHVVRIRSRVYNGENSKNLRIVGVAWDITERRQTELALARERNLLATLMENLPSYIYFKDLDCRFIAASRAMAEVHGRKDPAELIGLTDRDLFSSEHAEGALADELEIIRTGKPIVDYEEKETWPDREDTWVSTTKMPLRDAQGNLIGTFGISRDITEKKRAAEKLLRLTEELRAKNESLEQDLEMARELQSALLPQRFPNFPHDASEQDSAVRFYPFFRPSMIAIAISEAATRFEPQAALAEKARGRAPRYDGQTSMARSATRRSSDRPAPLATWTDIPCATVETNKANAAGSSVAGKSPSFFARMNRFLNASTAARRRAAISWHTASVLVPPTRIPFTPRQPGGWLESLSRSTVP